MDDKLRPGYIIYIYRQCIIACASLGLLSISGDLKFYMCILYIAHSGIESQTFLLQPLPLQPPMIQMIHHYVCRLEMLKLQGIKFEQFE